MIPAATGVDLGCVDADTEYLSPTGWKRIADYAGSAVMQYFPNSGIGTFCCNPLNYIVNKCDEFL